MALFTHEDFIILGMLYAKYFTAYIYDFGAGAYGGSSWSGGGGAYFPGIYPIYGTGRGGVILNKTSDGEDGRPGISDSNTGNMVQSLSGGKGGIDGPGYGLNFGGFGFGGRALTTTTGWTSAAGGGSGWFGGGSAYIDAGGGGGSSFVYSDTDLAKRGINAANQDVKQFPEWLQPGLWLGVSLETFEMYKLNSPLYITNTRHTSEYETLSESLGAAYIPFLDLHIRANGNGLVLISKPNELITINKESGSIDGIGDIIDYSGSGVVWKPDPSFENARYHFICWGAQGGTVMYTRWGVGGVDQQQYTGGFGGSASGIFNIPRTHLNENDETVETELYIYVGEQGNKRLYYNPFNGGGNGAGGCTSGGGSTDIRWGGGASVDWLGSVDSRFIVAGGGGGCIGISGGGAPVEPFTPPGVGSSLPGIIIPNPSGGASIPYFLVNDRSIVKVTLTYYTKSVLPDVRNLSCTIYINGGAEGVLTESFDINPINGSVEISYYLDQIYPPNTPTHWVTITAKVETDVMLVIPDNGVTIRVETRAGENEPNENLSPNSKPIFLRKVEAIDIFDICRAKIEQKTGDIESNQLDYIDVFDVYKVQLKAVQLLHVSILESLSIDDVSNNVFEMERPPEPVKDLYLHALESIDLVDIVKQQMKIVEKQSKDSIENIDASDIVRASFKKVTLLRCSVLETIDQNDICHKEATYENQ